MRFLTGRVAKGYAVAVLAAVVVAGCAQKTPVAITLPEPVVAPPPIPQRPYPPLGATPNMVIPPVGPDGVRMTVNTDLTPNQRLWNLRSAYNVAALNCREPEHAELIPSYGAFLKKHSRALSKANRELDAQFRKEHGSDYIRPRETYMTRVYNYFANPVTLDAFCDATTTMSRSLQLVEPGDLESYSEVALPQIEQVFESFFRAYEQYKIDLAAWEATYAPAPVTAGAAEMPAAPAFGPSSIQQ